MFKGKCPLCGTRGILWKKKPEIFVCPSCESVFSHFGFVLEAEEEPLNIWN